MSHSDLGGHSNLGGHSDLGCHSDLGGDSGSVVEVICLCFGNQNNTLLSEASEVTKMLISIVSHDTLILLYLCLLIFVGKSFN